MPATLYDTPAISNPSSSLKLKPHTPYKQPLVTRKPPLNPNHRKNRLQHIEKIAKFAGKY